MATYTYRADDGSELHVERDNPRNVLCVPVADPSRALGGEEGMALAMEASVLRLFGTLEERRAHREAHPEAYTNFRARRYYLVGPVE